MTKQLSGLPYQTGVKPDAGVIALWPDKAPTRTISGKNVTPDLATVTGHVSDRFGGLIDVGFDALGDRIRDAIGGNAGSITGNPTGVIDQNAVNSNRYGSMGGMSPMVLLAIGGAALYFVLK